MSQENAAKKKSSGKKRPIPDFGARIIETHCHLDFLKEHSPEQALADAQAVGIEKIVTISTHPDNLDTVLKLSQTLDAVYCTQGIHPHEAETYTEAVGEHIRANTEQARDSVVAVGEIGLDYYYDHADRAIQRKVFEQQLALACELDKPIVVHTREADEDTQAILGNFSKELKQKGVIHSFTSGIPLAEFCLDEGFHIGFNGIITFNKADNVREALAITPLDRIVAETDSPYLTPTPYRGRENGPRYLPFIIEKMAEVKAVSVEQMLDQLYRNSHQLFALN